MPASGAYSAPQGLKPSFFGDFDVAAEASTYKAYLRDDF